MDTSGWGTASVILGAGRQTVGDAIDCGAGILLRKKPGDYVKAGDAVAELFTNNKKSVPDAERKALESLTLGAQKPNEAPLVYARADKTGVH
jgi:pyrimidine-nucleoside phosphorylase